MTHVPVSNFSFDSLPFLKAVIVGTYEPLQMSFTCMVSECEVIHTCRRRYDVVIMILNYAYYVQN